MLACYPLVPLFRNQALGIALFSYDGRLYWGFNADWDAVPDLHDLVEAVGAEWAALCRVAGVPAEAGAACGGCGARAGRFRLTAAGVGAYQELPWRPGSVSRWTRPRPRPARRLRPPRLSSPVAEALAPPARAATRAAPPSACTTAARASWTCGAAIATRSGTPWQRDTMSPSFSTTKGVASTVVHVMVDRGLLDYDAPVADYWPEFAQNGQGRASPSATCSRTSPGSTTSGR